MQEQQRNAIQGIRFNAETGLSREQKRRASFHRGKERVQGAPAVNGAHRRKLGVQNVVAFHWLSCDSLSLAELLSGKVKNLPSSY